MYSLEYTDIRKVFMHIIGGGVSRLLELLKTLVQRNWTYIALVHVSGLRLSLNCGHQWASWFILQMIYEYGEPR
jgi:hypothetical protein